MVSRDRVVRVHPLDEAARMMDDDGLPSLSTRHRRKRPVFLDDLGEGLRDEVRLDLVSGHEAHRRRQIQEPFVAEGLAAMRLRRLLNGPARKAPRRMCSVIASRRLLNRRCCAVTPIWSGRGIYSSWREP